MSEDDQGNTMSPTEHTVLLLEDNPAHVHLSEFALDEAIDRRERELTDVDLHDLASRAGEGLETFLVYQKTSRGNSDDHRRRRWCGRFVLRTAALVDGVERVAEAKLARGLFP